MSTKANDAKISAAMSAEDVAWMDAQALNEQEQPDDGLAARRIAEQEAAAANMAAVVFDKDTFRDGHRVPSVSEIYTTKIVNAGKENEREDTKISVDKLGEWVEDCSGEHFISLNQGAEPFIYREGYYVAGVTGYLRTLLHVANRSKGVASNHVNEATYRIGTMASFDEAGIDREWSDITILNNCALNTSTCETMPHSPKHYAFSKLSCDYDKDATCPIWQEFLDYALPDKDDQKTLQEMFGATLKRSYHEQAAIFLLGAGGNGKGVVMNTLRAMLGAGKTSAVPLQQANQRFYSTDLYGRYANISGDTAPTALVDASTYKMLTGGDIIRAEYKGKDPFNFRNHATIINSMNDLPPTHDQSDGFMRRFVLIRFSVTPTADRKHEKRGFEQAMIDHEMPGILNWAIEGMKRLNAQDMFTFHKDKEVSDLRRIWNVEANHVEAFVDACCVTGASPKQYVATEVFMATYRRWHEDTYDVPPKEDQAEITKTAPWPGFQKPSAARVRASDADLWLQDDGRERTTINAYKGIYLKTTSGKSDVDMVYVAEHWHEITGNGVQVKPSTPIQLVDGGDNVGMVDKIRAAIDKAFEQAVGRHIEGISARDVYKAYPGGMGESSISEMMAKDQTMLGLIKKDGLYFRRG